MERKHQITWINMNIDMIIGYSHYKYLSAFMLKDEISQIFHLNILKYTKKLSFFQKSTQKVSEAYSEPNQKLSKAVGGRCSVKKVFSEILQNSQENTFK